MSACIYTILVCLNLNRPGSFDLSGHASIPHEPGGIFPVKKSQDAAVGALVHMLKKAPPLRQDISATAQLLQGSKLQTLRSCMQDTNETSEEPTSSNPASSGLIASKTTADALEELRGYREMKDLLLMQSKISQA
ncbi:Autophagy-related protein 13b [Sesamum angolense]|uniref:Autophagy-related protein 13b n=1 Tax=Sesamum angolense TaxID=2727404 RepID=A0AAE1WI39_9LAMI|nr:Autophagy-related protein 13b [Sesamum angolense]